MNKSVMKIDRNLKDYPPIPSTPPPSEKRDKGLVRLENELEKEKKYLCTLCVENKELEEILLNFDREMARIKNNFPDQIVGDKKIHAGNEYWFKYEAQMELIRKLEREKKCLGSEIRQIEEHGMVNLDALTQSELIIYVKQLERTKTNLLSDLRSKEWGLDKQARDIHHLNEVKRSLQAEIRHYDKEFSMFRHYKRNACPSASPIERRNSCGADEKRLRIWKQKEKSRSEKPSEKIRLEKASSLSQEDVAGDSKSEVMFSSLDETKLERMNLKSPTSSYSRRTTDGAFSERKKVIDGKQTPVKKALGVGSLPELSKAKSATPSPRSTKIKRAKTEHKVGIESAKTKFETPKSHSEPIQILVTYETQRTVINTNNGNDENANAPIDKSTKSASEATATATTTMATTRSTTSEEEKKSSDQSFWSIEEVYEEDFENGSDKEENTENCQKIGYLTTTV